MSSLKCLPFKQKPDDKEVEPPNDILVLFDKYSDNRAMSLDQLHKFLVDYQGEDEADVEEILSRLDRHNIQQRGLNFDAFFSYLLKDLNTPLPQKDHQDLNAPLAHYFMYTRVKARPLNLRKGKLTSTKLKRSIKAITEALKKGVRVIQLDLSSTSKKNVSNIIHEGPVISKVLNDCLGAIKENAFSASEYPVIIIFEGHLELKLQSTVAQKAKIMLGETFYCLDEDVQTFPLKELKRKILIPQLQKEPSATEKEENAEKIKSLDYEKLKGKLSEILTTDSDKNKWYRMSQPDLEKAIKHHEAQFIKYTQRNLLTIYPKDKITGSSNCNPLTGWIHGAQMVAVNTQGYDKYLWITHGMFRANGQCGYVKKPDILLNSSLFDPNTSLRVKTTLKAKIYMGHGWHLDFSRLHFDLLSPPDFFIKVQILGVPKDYAKEETQVEENKWAPTWNQEFEFDLTVPQLAFLRIEVRDFDDEKSSAFGGQTCLPVWELKKGIRAVRLYDKRGEQYKDVRLLMQFQFDDKN